MADHDEHMVSHMKRQPMGGHSPRGPLPMAPAMKRTGGKRKGKSFRQAFEDMLGKKGRM